MSNRPPKPKPNMRQVYQAARWWLVVFAAVALAGTGLQKGQAAVQGLLVACWKAVLAWALVNAIILACIALGAALGHPFRRNK